MCAPCGVYEYRMSTRKLPHASCGLTDKHNVTLIFNVNIRSALCCRALSTGFPMLFIILCFVPGSPVYRMIQVNYMCRNCMVLSLNCPSSKIASIAKLYSLSTMPIQCVPEKTKPRSIDVLSMALGSGGAGGAAAPLETLQGVHSTPCKKNLSDIFNVYHYASCTKLSHSRQPQMTLFFFFF